MPKPRRASRRFAWSRRWRKALPQEEVFRSPITSTLPSKVTDPVGDRSELLVARVRRLVRARGHRVGRDDLQADP